MDSDDEMARLVCEVRCVDFESFECGLCLWGDLADRESRPCFEDL